ncbi:MAG: hypothetical protein LBC56_06725 [Oscillospiraceae bacterium]|jgi:DNA-directed RNA polymerase subunit RPC12/RpoP|nr:hypothetical protein [Oscillospiraceae bacterium]
MGVLEYKCPACGGALTFSSALQKMHCPFCESDFDMETVRKYNDALVSGQSEREAAQTAIDTGVSSDRGEFQSFSCPSCGGQIITDANTVATECPYCNNPAIVRNRVEDILKPDYVIPFKLDKEAAKAALAGHLKGKALMPAAFRTQNRIDSIKGIYVPFWLYDCETYAAINYSATKVTHWSDHQYDYIKTDHYQVFREGYLSFDKVSADGSTKMDDAYMEAIEPYDYKTLVPFETAYLSGYMADKYDLDSEKCKQRASSRIKSSTESVFAGTVRGYASCVPTNSDVRFNFKKAHYALMPVWMLNTKYKDKIYTFAMNAQSGKFVGELPLSWGKFFAWFAGLAVGLGLVFNLIAALVA